MAAVCCSIVAGVRWKQTFLGVEDLWEVGVEAGLQTSAVELGVLSAWRAVEEGTSYADLVTRSGTCPVLSPIQKYCMAVFHSRRHNQTVSTQFLSSDINFITHANPPAFEAAGLSLDS